MNTDKTSKINPAHLRASTTAAPAYADQHIRLHPDRVARALGIGRIIDADEMLDLLRKLRDGAVTDSNRIGELSSQLDEMTHSRDRINKENNELRQRVNDAQDKLNSEAERNNVLNEHSRELLGQIVSLTDERDKATEALRKALAERNQARAAFRALAQRVDFDTFCDLLLNWGTDK